MNNSTNTLSATGHCTALFKLFSLLGLVFLFSTTGFASSEFPYEAENRSSENAFCNLRVWFKNTGCKKMEIFTVNNNREQHAKNVNANGTAEFDATKGDRFVVRIDGRKVKDWKVPNCKDQTQMIDTKGCDENCHVHVKFKNTGCNRLYINRVENNLENRVGHINPNETTTIDASKDQRYILRLVEGGRKVKDWKVSSCETTTQQVNSGNCSETCRTRVWFKNTGCRGMDIYTVENGKERHANRVNANGTAEFDVTKGKRFVVRVDGRKVKDWTVSGSCKDETQMIDTKGCTDSKPDCKDIKISTSKGKVTVKGLKKAPISEVKIMKKDGRTQVAGCRKCNRDSKTFRVDEGNYWVIVTYYDQSWKRICEVKKDVKVKAFIIEQNTSSNRVLSLNESTLLNQSVSKTTLEPITATNTNGTTELQSHSNLTTTALKVYPNPASSVLFVDVTTGTDQPLEMNLLNAQGQIVEATTVAAGNNTVRFELGTQPAGIYLIRLQSQDGSSLVKKFMVK